MSRVVTGDVVEKKTYASKERRGCTLLKIFSRMYPFFFFLENINNRDPEFDDVIVGDFLEVAGLYSLRI